MKRNSPFFTIYIPKDKPDLLEKLDELHWKERKSVNKIGIEAITEYLEKHSDGNPNFTLDQFQDTNFKACPAFFRDTEAWRKYLQSLDKKRYKEADEQLNLLHHLFNERFGKFD